MSPIPLSSRERHRLRSPAAALLQNTAVGTVTAGEFTGATAVITWIYPLANPLQCLMPGGLTVQDGTIAVQITGL
ncbi:hypothetical protein EDD29_5298 [Actinocorallia herbida]|uniref:Uncharacterized protein n=1 Tax=Actinocorallia herbida TaxID=58109 RepID=A0A3N1D2C7_9ACTN|nr:hypothetical protein [Actinocorallia herbida]ROO87671.1 hypothetical protein EDD29_5298 [Actinocorallia herbida]